MIKQLTLGAVLLSATLLTGCGGGGSSSAPAATSGYTTLQDLEYKTLTLEEYWHTIKDDTKNKTHSTMIFKDRYTDKGYLIDERSSKAAVRLCTVLDEGDYKYMCLTSYFKENTTTVKSSALYVFNISTTDKVTGNFAYSDTANTDDLLRSVSTRESAMAWITGTASATVSSKVTSKLTNTLNSKQLALSKTNVNANYKVTQESEYLNTILTDMQSVLLNK